MSFRDVLRLTSRHYGSYDLLVDAFLQEGCRIFSLETGIASQVVEDRYIVQAIETPLDIEQGAVFPLADTYCAAVHKRQQTVAWPHVGSMPEMNGHPAYVGLALEAYISTPIFVRDVLYGTLNWSSQTPRDAFGDEEIELVECMAETMGRFLELREVERDRQQAHRERAEFVSVVSHEIRTPLTAIRGSLELLTGQYHAVLPHGAGRLLDMASRNTLRLSRLVDDLLDLDRLELDRVQLVTTDVPIRPLLDEVTRALRPAGRTIEVDAADLLVRADRHRTAQVVTNLLGNALKYADGHIVVRAIPDDDATVRIEVEDDGPGIPADQLDAVFEKFRRLHGQGPTGTGLGLAISKAFVEAMEGRIGVRSPPGAGATFWFSLPAA